jgi:adenosylmethionine---8-amino-7-oxononanoate aminotransferase
VLPLGVTAATEEIFAGFLSDDRRRTLFHGHSFAANPIACAAARASLRLLDQASAAQREAIHRVHTRQLKRFDGCPLVTQPRVLGTVAAFDLEVRGGYLSPIGRELASFALAQDVLLRPLGNVVYVLPPYCATVEELDHVYSVIWQFLTTH